MIFQGNSVSEGIAIGKVFIFSPFNPKVEVRRIDPAETADHAGRLRNVLKQAEDELMSLQREMAEKDAEKAGIFEAHQDILNDDEMLEEIFLLIEKENYAADSAIETIYEKYCKLFNEMEDELMRERSADFKDLKIRLLRIWAGVRTKGLSEISVPSIIFARDLLPSDTATLDRTKVLAIVTETGGSTSHSAILAKSYGIPAILGIKDILAQAEKCRNAIVDAVAGKVILEPSSQEIEMYSQKLTGYQESIQEIKKYQSIQEAQTSDGERIEVCVNIGSAKDEELAAASFTDGVGLFRSEFLFMAGKELPDENTQLEAYKKVTERYGKKQVILRTLDIGGDKPLECLNLPHEANPFLGCRALRLCFKEKQLFKTQLRAALRASVYGNLALMFPMVGSIEDYRRARDILYECQDELDHENISYNKQMPIGIMIEIPAIALMAEQVARDVDFASIGTNDLCQYLLAADRLNSEVAEYYQSYHPAMFRLIHQVSSSFLKEGKPLSICGEMGGDPLAVMAFIGMGIQKFSMAPANVAPVKQIISHLSRDKARRVLDAVLSLNTEAEIRAALKEFHKTFIS
jgi:phosphotransferase system enzyme I (PtsI)